MTFIPHIRGVLREEIGVVHHKDDNWWIENNGDGEYMVCVGIPLQKGEENGIDE